MIFIDSNIPMYVAGQAHAHRKPALDFMQRVRDGKVAACTSTEVLQEILYRYNALKRLDVARQVYELFVELCPVVHPVSLADTDRAKALLCTGSGIGVRDAIHAAVMLNRDVHQIATFDRAFDRIPGIKRLKL